MDVADEEARADLAHELATQDNRITAEPIYMVQERVLDVGMDPDYSEQVCWSTSEKLVTEASDPARFARFEAGVFSEDEDGDADDWTRTGYRTRWENRQPFLTLKAAEAYRVSQAHNLWETRVYVESAHRNPEWRLIRLLLGATAAKPNDELVARARLGAWLAADRNRTWDFSDQTRHAAGALIVELWSDSNLDAQPDVQGRGASLAEAINAALDLKGVPHGNG